MGQSGRESGGETAATLHIDFASNPITGTRTADPDPYHTSVSKARVAEAVPVNDQVESALSADRLGRQYNLPSAQSVRSLAADPSSIQSQFAAVPIPATIDTGDRPGLRVDSSEQNGLRLMTGGSGMQRGRRSGK